MLQFKMDENLPVEAADLLRRAGYDARTIHDQQMVGQPDDAIAAVCQREQRAIVTLDTDFANIRTYPPDEYAGIIVLRLRRQDKAHVLAILSKVLPKLTSEKLTGTLWIVDEHRIRVRE